MSVGTSFFRDMRLPDLARGDDSLMQITVFKENTMKKCILVFLCVFLCFGISSAQAVHYTTGAAMDIAVRDFDTLYPGLTQEMKDNIWMSVVIDNPQWRESSEFTFQYKKEGMIRVRVTVDLTTGEATGSPEWPLAQLIEEYESGISREQAEQIALQTYNDSLTELEQQFPKNYQAFVERYGEEQLSSEHMVLYMMYISQYNCGEKGQDPIWYISVIHEMNRPSDLPYDSDAWLLLTVNAHTGEVLEKTLDNNCEPFVLKPWPFRK